MVKVVEQWPETARVQAGFSWEAARELLLEHGGRRVRGELGDEGAKAAFDLLLELSSKKIAEYFSDRDALKRLVEDLETMQKQTAELVSRPVDGQRASSVAQESRDRLQRLAPRKLIGREKELSDLKEFVLGDEGSWLAYQAPAASGKTGLLATFALNPPENVWVVSHFVRRNEGLHDRDEFVLSVLGQLAEMVQRYYVRHPQGAEQNNVFQEALKEAWKLCEASDPKIRLVLVVDGLDEDAFFEGSESSGRKSILSVFPLRLPAGVKVITASRPNPKAPPDVLCQDFGGRVDVNLTLSEHAAKSVKREEVVEFLESEGGLEVAAFLAASRGVLTVDNLKQLLRCLDLPSRLPVQKMVDRSPGRMLLRQNVGYDGVEVWAYRLGHDFVTRAVLRELKLEEFGEGPEPEEQSFWSRLDEEALQEYREIICKWGEARTEKGWSERTPGYLLSSGYLEVLQRTDGGGWSCLEVLANSSRNDEVVRRHGSAYRVISDIDMLGEGMLREWRASLTAGQLGQFLALIKERARLSGSFIYVPGLVKYMLSDEGSESSRLVIERILTLSNPESMVAALEEYVDSEITAEEVESCLESLGSVYGWVRYSEQLCGRVRRVEIRALLKSGKMLDRACEAARQVEEPHSRAEALKDVAVALVGADRGSKAVELLREAGESARHVRNSLFRTVALKGVAQAMAGAGQLGAALGLAQQVEDPRGRAKALAGVAVALVEDGRRGAALVLARQVEDPRGRAEALKDVAQALVVAGRESEAVERLREAGESARQVEDPRGRAEALKDVAQALVVAGRESEAVELLREAGESAQQVEDPYSRAEALKDVSAVLVESGWVDEAVVLLGEAGESARQVRNSLFRTVALKGVAEVMVGAGQVGAALDFARQVEDPRGRAEALTGVAQAMAGIGQVDEAGKVIDEVLENARQVDDPNDHANALTGMTQPMAGAGQASEVTESAGQVKYPNLREKDLWGVAMSLMDAGQLDLATAVGLARQMEDPGERAQALKEMAQMLAQAGEHDKAAAIVQDVLDPNARGEGLNTVIHELCAKNKGQKAIDLVQGEYEWVRSNSFERDTVSGFYGVLARACSDGARTLAEQSASESEASTLKSLARTGLAHSWMLGASVWDNFAALLHVAPDLAYSLVNERLLNGDKQSEQAC
ncbi:hypothetical protein [Actinomyces weissii]|uniref:Uncharacterized protein n=1 Tax=Actinomyces weissii TaxID=675090 RepID=A0A7T7S1Q9_9ACTO|nr:hypothetical protein [Actinomyces weissii]QQM66644.1 hypothetical protein JG540_05930 [Actinomyces weissii]